MVIDELLLLYNAHSALAIGLPPLLLELGRLSEFERSLTSKPMRQSAKVTGYNTQPSTVSKLRDKDKLDCWGSPMLPGMAAASAAVSLVA